MTLPPEASASPAAAAAPADGGATLTPPVIVGPIAVSSFGGIPMIGINGPIHHFSGGRLRALIMKALAEAGLTIEIPE
ncbi:MULTISPECIES: hypothetical protein [Mycobacteriaceae]|jgi:hypothetical protein|uniref:hypothetical protein n=1 Tax=Mycobacteriaceae TaxID=1762 RepID=UPI0009FDC39D|nr:MULTISPECIES: hypothetical protein [Mycobacteriaceae]MBU8840224.1 hypothetical protein [Mycolicibacterium goodii]UCN12619.1 hypothetical protein LFT50_29450 [Mycobacterium intracellulare subsp. chimaera]